MRKITLLILTLVLALTGCNLPVNLQNQPSPTIDMVATQVAELLTAQPAPTLASGDATKPPSPTQTPAVADVPTATVTQSPTATLTPAPTSTTNPTDPAASLGTPTWEDGLDSAKNFYLYENDNTKVEGDNSALALTGLTANGWLGWTLTYTQKPTNFYVEATFRTHDCSQSDLYGLIFRASKENAGYFFGVTCDGRYNLYARDFNNNTNAELIGLKSAASILSGANQTNRLGVLAEGSKISLYINGVLVDEITDSTYASGYFGAFIAANQTAGFRADLEQIRLWKL
jgi:hypothetical protein